jgi:hypothetical protein
MPRPMAPASLRTAIALCAAVLAVAACGESDEDEVREALDRGFTTSDASVCTELATRDFVESLYGPGRQGLEACRRDVTSERAESITVANLEVDGQRASADVRVTGGEADGQALVVRLLREGDRWKLHELRGINVSGEVGREVERQVRRNLEASGLKPAVVSCILGGIREDLAQHELGRLEGGELPSALQARIEEATRACLEGARAAAL